MFRTLSMGFETELRWNPSLMTSLMRPRLSAGLQCFCISSSCRKFGKAKASLSPSFALAKIHLLVLSSLVWEGHGGFSQWLWVKTCGHIVSRSRTVDLRRCQQRQESLEDGGFCTKLVDHRHRVELQIESSLRSCCTPAQLGFAGTPSMSAVILGKSCLPEGWG